MKKTGIYKIENRINGKLYIGSSVDIYQRWRGHSSDLGLGKHKNKHLQSAWNKFGAESFVFAIIEYCKEQDILDREQYYIDKYKACIIGYNLSPVAGQSRKGLFHTQEAKLKMSNSHRGNIPWNKGIPISEEQRKYLGTLNKGKKHSEETKQKLRDNWGGGMTGKHFSEESRRKMSLSHIGKKLSEEQKQKMSAAMKGRILPRESNGNFMSPKLLVVGSNTGD